MIEKPVRIVIPTLETERLVLNAPRETDFAGYASIVTTERGRWIGGPLNREEAWLDFSQMIAGWVLRGFGSLSIRPKGREKYLGTVLVHHEFGDAEPELGWLLIADAERRGYAFEAGLAIRDWAFANTELRTLISYIDPSNKRALALAERLGGRRVKGPPGVLTYRYHANRDRSS